eukprot:384761_1
MMATEGLRDFNMQFAHFCNDPFWYCSHCGSRNDYTQKRCSSCFKLKIQSNKNKPIIVVDIDETLIASKDKNEKDIRKEYLNNFVDKQANKLGEQYQKTMNLNHNKHKIKVDHLTVDFSKSPPPNLSPSIIHINDRTNSVSIKRNEENSDIDDCNNQQQIYVGLNVEHKFDEHHIESSREPNPNRYLSPIKKHKRKSIMRNPKVQPESESETNTPNVKPIKKKTEHQSRATIDISQYISKCDVEEYEPYESIKKDMIYKSLTTKGKYYYIYFRDGAKEFLQTLIGWKLTGHIQLCIMTAANKYYANSILAHLLGCNKFENYFDCIVTKEHLPWIRISNNKDGLTNEETIQSTKYRRVKCLDIIYEILDCNRSVKCVMIDDNLRNFDMYDKLMGVYNIVEYRNPLDGTHRYMDNKLFNVQTYIQLVAINKYNTNQIIETELNNAYKKYLYYQSDSSLKQKIINLERNGVGVQNELLYHVLIKKTETLHKKIRIVHEFSKKEKIFRANHKNNSRRNTAKYLDRLLNAVNISSFEYLDRYLMSGLIRIKKNDRKAFKNECELLATVVLFYRLYFTISN